MLHKYIYKVAQLHNIHSKSISEKLVSKNAASKLVRLEFILGLQSGLESNFAELGLEPIGLGLGFEPRGLGFGLEFSWTCYNEMSSNFFQIRSLSVLTIGIIK